MVDGLLDFCAATGLELLFAINGGPAAAATEAAAAAAALDHASNNNDNNDDDIANANAHVHAHASSNSNSSVLYGWELGNEPNLYWFPSNGE